MSMTREQYQRYGTHPLRELFSNLASGHAYAVSNSRSELRTAIREALHFDGFDAAGAEKIYAALEAQAIKIAQEAGAADDRFEYRGRVDAWIVARLEEFDATDMIVQPVEEEVIDLDGLVSDIENQNTIGGRLPDSLRGSHPGDAPAPGAS